jgi:hypothetical protein
MKARILRWRRKHFFIFHIISRHFDFLALQQCFYFYIALELEMRSNQFQTIQTIKQFEWFESLNGLNDLKVHKEQFFNLL